MPDVAIDTTTHRADLGPMGQRLMRCALCGKFRGAAWYAYDLRGLYCSEDCMVVAHWKLELTENCGAGYTQE